MKKLTVKIEVGVMTDNPDGDLIKVHEVLKHGTVRDAFYDAGLDLDHLYVVDAETQEERKTK